LTRPGDQMRNFPDAGIRLHHELQAQRHALRRRDQRLVSTGLGAQGGPWRRALRRSTASFAWSGTKSIPTLAMQSHARSVSNAGGAGGSCGWSRSTILNGWISMKLGIADRPHRCHPGKRV